MVRSIACLAFLTVTIALNCGGGTGVGCGPGEFCRTPAYAHCDAEGYCLAFPTQCPFVEDPVCGCDGITYRTSCDAYSVGVNIQDLFACPKKPAIAPSPKWMLPPLIPPPPPIAPVPRRLQACYDSQICSTGTVCVLSGCAKGSKGVCTPFPTYCPIPDGMHEQVCGCDGKTYTSICFAVHAGVAISGRGACAVPEAPPSSPTERLPRGPKCTMAPFSPCPYPYTDCIAEPGQCPFNSGIHAGPYMAIGTCVNTNKLDACSGTVCGCDGLEYASDCEAYVNGVSVYMYGTCPPDGSMPPSPLPPSWPLMAPEGSCSDNTDCAEQGTYCYKSQPGCEGYGSCVRYGDTPDCLSEPPTGVVCGCDGTAYDNACFASWQGVSILGFGLCGKEPQSDPEPPQKSDGGCRSDLDCAGGEFCNFDDAICGQAMIPGECMAIPKRCSLVFRPDLDQDKLDDDSSNDADVLGEVVASTAQTKSKQAPVDLSKMRRIRLPKRISRPDQGAAARKADSAQMEAEVCGCDGQTYQNACQAHKHSISIERYGACLVE